MLVINKIFIKLKDFININYKYNFVFYFINVILGSYVYFILPFEISFIYIIILFIVFLCFIKNNYIKLLLCFLGGFLYTSLYTNIINTPIISYNLYKQDVIGTIENIDYSDDKIKILLKIPASIINKQYKENKVAFIRLTIKQINTNLDIGDVIKAKTTIFKPNQIDSPNSFNYQRWLYFNRLSGIGFVYDYKILNKNNTISNINYLRSLIHKKTNNFLTDSLILGYKNALSTTDKKTWANIGVAHIWSISGFHISIIFCLFYSVFYFLFRLIPYIAIRFTAKKVALFCSLIFVLGYLFISGLSVATMRAFFMLSFIVFGLLFDRNILNLKNILLVMFILFILNPHYIMEAGFQLSFSAIFGIYVYNKYFYIRHDNKIINYIKTLFFISMFSMLFTLPFIMFHFNSIPVYSILSNLIIVPIFAIVFLPFVFISTFLALFGNFLLLDKSIIFYNYLFKIADFIKKLPYSNIQTPYLSNFTLICFVLCLLSYFIINSKKEKIIFSSICFIIGIYSMFFYQKPLFYSSYNNELVAFKNKYGYLEFNKIKSSNNYYSFNTWKIFNNEKINTKNKKYKCIKGICYYNTKKWNLVYITRFKPLFKNLINLCNNKNINYIVSMYNIDSKNCKNKILNKSFVIYSSGKVRHFNQNRIWTK